MIRGRFIWSLVAFVAAFMVFARVRSYGDNTGIPIRYDYPVRFDRWMFSGNDPVIWLQTHLGQAGRLDVVDYLLVFVYITYFVVPPATVALLWWTRSRAFPLLALSIMVTLYVGLAINFIVPTAPPWLAAQNGYMPDFTRLVPKALNNIVPGIFRTGDNMAGANDVAAMPSLHLAIVAVVSFYFMTRGRVGALIGALYILAMGFALVYLGEHYVTDIVAGFAVALVSWLAVKWALSWWYQRRATDKMPAVEQETARAGPR